MGGGDEEGARSGYGGGHLRLARGGREGVEAVPGAGNLYHPGEAACGVEAARHQVPVPRCERYAGAERLTVQAKCKGAVRVEEETEAAPRHLRPGAEQSLRPVAGHRRPHVGLQGEAPGSGERGRRIHEGEGAGVNGLRLRRIASVDRGFNLFFAIGRGIGTEA